MQPPAGICPGRLLFYDFRIFFERISAKNGLTPVGAKYGRTKGVTGNDVSDFQTYIRPRVFAGGLKKCPKSTRFRLQRGQGRIHDFNLAEGAHVKCFWRSNPAAEEGWCGEGCPHSHWRVGLGHEEGALPENFWNFYMEMVSCGRVPPEITVRGTPMLFVPRF